jgi:hypothetical protein
MRACWGRPECWVSAILLGSYAFFWHPRDWNTSSRLMLTYAIVDRGTVAITGLEEQTRDKAFFEGEYYSDKLPGYSLLATVPYAICRWAFRLPPHPLNVPAMRYWPADYWVTLGISGVLTAATAFLLVLWARELGCPPRRAALVGLAYGLATPAYVYATLAYGHQASAFALLCSFFLLWKQTRRGPRESLCMFTAGFLAASSAVIELQVGPVSAILGFYLLAQCLKGDRRPDALGLFAVGAALPSLLLLAYNQLAFGSPWDMGYFHHATERFARVHNRDNPLGLKLPDQFWDTLGQLLLGRYRGLAFYAPIVLVAVPGWAVLVARRARSVAIVSFLSVAAVLLVNLLYPEWTGGWSTGPRLLVPSLPFAMLAVAGLLAGNSRVARVSTLAALVLALAGGVEMLMFQGAGGRIPPDFRDPLAEAVWPLWKGQTSLPGWRFDERFCRNLVSLCAPAAIAQLPPTRQALQFLPLVLVQAFAILGLWRFLPAAHRAEEPGGTRNGRDAARQAAQT